MLTVHWSHPRLFLYIYLFVWPLYRWEFRPQPNCSLLRDPHSPSLFKLLNVSHNYYYYLKLTHNWLLRSFFPDLDVSFMRAGNLVFLFTIIFPGPLIWLALNKYCWVNGCVCKCVCVCICVYMYIYTQIHTHTHKKTRHIYFQIFRNTNRIILYTFPNCLLGDISLLFWMCTEQRTSCSVLYILKYPLW